MGREELAALARIIDDQLKEGTNSPLQGTWTIRFDKERSVLYFDKCEFGDYCEERPAVVALDGRVVDKGGPLLELGSQA
jgi:hypothetical protein